MRKSAGFPLNCAAMSAHTQSSQPFQAIAPQTVHIALGDRSYPIVIGSQLLDNPATWAGLPRASRALIVTNTTVGPLYAQRLQAALQTHYPTIHTVVLPDGEAFKNWETLNLIFGALLGHGCDRKTVLFALGGGVVGDMTGFAAASYMRGVPFVQVPTTLLAQVDSSVGGKTGINTAFGKNLLGAFHQPRIVLADTDVLATLPARELRAGYAEIVKTGLIGDADFFTWCEQHGSALLAGDGLLLAEAIARACAFKAAVVEGDEREDVAQGGRALLNMGHTFAHALEAEYGYTGELLHGEAVSLGLVLAFRLSAKLDFCTRADADRVSAHLRDTGMPFALSALGRGFSAAGLMSHMQRDKKMRDGKLAFVLARTIGEAFTCRDVPDEAVAAVLRDAGCAD